MRRMNAITASFLVWIFLLLALPAFAGNPFVEPYVGIGQIQVSIFNSGDYDLKDISSGFTAGIKAGYVFTQRFFAGLDYQASGPYKFGRYNGNAEWNLRLIGAGIGLDYEISRFWAGYYDQQIDESRTGSTVKYKGNAIKVGFGLKVAKNAHANVDYVLHTITTAESASGSYSGNFPKVETFFISLSLPIDFK